MPSFDSINQLTLPAQVESRMRELVQRQWEGKLSASERHELDLIIEAREALGMIRAKAQTLLASAPSGPNQPGRTIRNGLPVVLVPVGTPAIDPGAVRRFLEEQAF